MKVTQSSGVKTKMMMNGSGLLTVRFE